MVKMSDITATGFIGAFATYARFSDEKIAEVAFSSLFALNHRATDNFLCANHKLPASIVSKLSARKLAAHAATSLYARELSPESLEAALKKEKRDTVMRTLLSWNQVSGDQALVAMTVGPGSAALIARDNQIPLTVRLEALNRCSLQVRLELAYELGSGLVSDEALSGWLSDIELWPTTRSAPRREIASLLRQRPGLFDTITKDSHPVLISVAAGSPYLTDERVRARVITLVMTSDDRFAILALAANPRVDATMLNSFLPKMDSALGDQLSGALHNRRNRPQVTSSFAAVEDPAVLAWLKRRAFPSDFSDTGKPLEIIELAHNPSIPVSDRVQALRTVARSTPWLATEAHALILELGADVNEYAETFTVLEPTYGEPEAPDFESIASKRFMDMFASYGVVVDFAAGCSQILGDSAQAWETMWKLIPGFDGSNQELLEIAAAL